jgi:flagellar biosynthetic protein FlhB
MADDSGQERSEQASAKRREDFRKKGQVAQSKEIHTAALLSTALLLWYVYAPRFWSSFSELLSSIWRQSAQVDVTPLEVVSLLIYLMQRLGILMAPLFLVMFLVGFFSTFLQIGWLFTTQPLMPDLGKLNPIKGMGRFFSRRSLVEVVKSLAKVLLVAYVAYRTIEGEFHQAMQLVDMSAAQTLLFIGRVSALVLFKTCGVLVLLALLDFLFVRWEMEQKMKMTKQEQKEEYKETEGDPHLKSRIRSLQQEVARKRMMADVPKADVVITNPTHLAVALRYDRMEMDSPQVVAKGKGQIALRIREIAQEHDVPIVENIPVAQALYKVDLGATIPEEMFRAVAEILAYVYDLKRTSR